MKELFYKLRDNPKLALGEKLHPVNRGYLASEYADEILDFTNTKSPLSNRLIPPYITSQTHGKDVFKNLINYLGKIQPKNIMDLGCGAGEFLQLCKKEYSDIEYFGCTIHLGEVIYAHKNGLNNVIPADMRNIKDYFVNNFFDCVIAHCSLHFIPVEERYKLSSDVFDILNQNGIFIVVDYKEIENTGLVNYDPRFFLMEDTILGCMGKVKIFKKI